MYSLSYFLLLQTRVMLWKNVTLHQALLLSNVIEINVLKIKIQSTENVMSWKIFVRDTLFSKLEISRDSISSTA